MLATKIPNKNTHHHTQKTTKQDRNKKITLFVKLKSYPFWDFFLHPKVIDNPKGL